ncbi:MAG: hypothetical protein HUK14_04260 [Muribaculaceae bacterium]|nr:hypothetical protein [Muribaculaceae bacterium]
MAKLQFGDNHHAMYSTEYNVVDWKGHFKTHHNNIMPDGSTYCESFELVLVAPTKDDPNFSIYDWYINLNAVSGRLLFDYSCSVKDNRENRIIAFENAHCYAMSEEYSIEDKARRLLRLKIIPEQITVFGHRFNITGNTLTGEELPTREFHPFHNLNGPFTGNF